MPVLRIGTRSVDPGVHERASSSPASLPLRHCQCLAARPNRANKDVPFSHASEGRVEAEEGIGRGTADGRCSSTGAAGPRGAQAEEIHFMQQIPRADALQALHFDPWADPGSSQHGPRRSLPAWNSLGLCLRVHWREVGLWLRGNAGGRPSHHGTGCPHPQGTRRGPQGTRGGPQGIRGGPERARGGPWSPGCWGLCPGY